jgi:hypothetical protein
MSRTKHDYPALRLEYIQTDISIRELCKKHDIANWSTVNEMKRKQGWDADREKFKISATGREIESLTASRMADVVAIHSELLLAVRTAIRRFINDLNRTENPQPVSARDLMGLIDKFLLLTGQPTARTESTNLDVHDFGGLLRGAPPELLRELAELARANGAGAGPVGRGPLIQLEGTRPS